MFGWPFERPKWPFHAKRPFDHLDDCSAAISTTLAEPERRDLARVITLVSVFSISPLLGSFSKGPPRPMRTSELSGWEYLKEVLNCKNPRRCPEVLGMKVEVFQFLCLELQRKGKLCASKHVDVDEQVGMFLWTVVKAASNREVQERFQRSGDTVSRHFHQALKAITFLIPEWIMLPIKPIMIADTVSSNSKFYPYFNDCIGALDGTHIAAKVSEKSHQHIGIERAGYLKMSLHVASLTICYLHTS